MTTTRTVAVLTASALLGALAMATVDAHAQYRRTHAAICRAAPPDWTGPQAPLGIVDSQLVGGGVIDDSQAFVMCPINSDALVGYKTPGIVLEVSGWANGVTAWAPQACIAFYSGGGAGGACGQAPPASGAGVKHAHVDTTAWTTTSTDTRDFPFVFMTLGAMSSGSDNNIWGIALLGNMP